MIDESIALVHGRIHTLDGPGTVAEGIYIEHGSIKAVGTSAEVLTQVPDAVRVVDLEGRVVLPGMIDAHAHVELSALADHFWLPVRELPVDETLARIRDTAASTPAGDWIVAQGTFGQELPTLAQLDEAAPHHPVVVRQSMHMQVANSRALELSGVDQSFVPPVGIRAFRDATGSPSGCVEEGFDLFPASRPHEEPLSVALRKTVLEGWVRHGVTTIHELPASTNGMLAWQRLNAQGDMPCRIIVNPILAPGHQAIVESAHDFVRLGLARGFGDNWLHLGSLKLFLDGAGPAALWYRDLSGEAAGWGTQNYIYNELVQILAACRRGHTQVWMHAVGDAAQSLAVNAIEAVNTALGNANHRTRVEHICLAVSDWSLLPRIREAGIIPVPTAAFMHFEPDDREQSLPAGGRLYPYRSVIEAGLRPPGNSDSAGTQPFATNPWHGISLMMLRRNKNGVVFGPSDEALSVEEAIHSYTSFGAYVGFEENLKGSLEVGKLGDLAVYGEDPFHLSPEALPTLEADITVVGGTVRYEKGVTG